MAPDLRQAWRQQSPGGEIILVQVRHTDGKGLIFRGLRSHGEVSEESDARHGGLCEGLRIFYLTDGPDRPPATFNKEILP
jgi:hypothetical protein